MNCKVVLLGMLSGFLFLSGCGEDGGNQNKDNFDRGPMLVNMADNIIMPAYTDFLAKSKTLVSTINELSDSVSTARLEAAQEAWLEAKLSWKYVQIFNFGPVESELIETAIDFWPISGVGVENEIADYDGSANYLDGVGNNKKGLAALEYILFHSDTVEIELQNANRTAYLSALTVELEAHAQLILDSWNAGYKATFVANTGNDVGASATALANEMIFLVEIIKNYKVAIPAGISTGGMLYPDKVESYYAKASIELILKNLDAVEEVFTGKDGQGFDDYVDALESNGNTEKLSDMIVDQIAACRTTASSIDGPLQDALESQSATLEQLFIDLQALTVLMKTDMMSRLGLIVTYSDNDGD